jgi:hypothetical protein
MMAEPITITAPLWQWLLWTVLMMLGGILGRVTADWLTGKTKPKKASVDA